MDDRVEKGFNNLIYILIFIIVFIIIILSSFTHIDLAFLIIFFCFLILIVSLIATKIIEYFSLASIRILVFDIRYNTYLILETGLSVIFTYYFVASMFFYLLLKIALLKTPLDLDQTDDYTILMFSIILSFIPRMTYYTKGFQYSKKVFLSIITPLSIFSIICQIYELHLGHSLNFNISGIIIGNVINFILAGVVFSVTAWIFGDCFIWLSRKTLYEHKLIYNSKDEMKSQIRIQNVAIIERLFKQWRESTGDKKSELEDGINYAYQLSITEMPAHIINIISMSRMAYYYNDELRSYLLKELNKPENTTIIFDIIRFKLEVYNNNQLLEKDALIKVYSKYTNKYRSPNSKPFVEKLIKSCFEDYENSDWIVKRIAKRTIQYLGYEYLSWGLKENEQEKFKEIFDSSV